MAELSCPCGRDTPFCIVWDTPFCCEGTSGDGECSAVIADAAEGPELAEGMGCERAVDMPEMGSALDGGHSPRGAFLRAHVDPSPCCTGPPPFVCAEEVDIVLLDDAVDESDDDELARWTLFRGMNIARYSSVVIGFAPLATPLEPFHPAWREMFWKFGGGATAVIDMEVRSGGFRVSSSWIVRGLASLFYSHDAPCS